MAKKVEANKKVRTFRIKAAEDLKTYSYILAAKGIVYTVKAIKNGFEFKTVTELTDEEREAIVEACK